MQIETKFYEFSQNNSGGYFVENDTFGICEYVIIEAISAKAAWHKLEEIGENVSELFDYCPCCGERWSSPFEDEAKDEPMLYDTPISEVEKSWYRNRAFVHYHDGSFKEFVFKEKQAA